MYLKIIFTLVLTSFSFSVFSDTYPPKIEWAYYNLLTQTLSATPNEACSKAKDIYTGSSYVLSNIDLYSYLCKIKDSNNSTITQANVIRRDSCPYGGNQTTGYGNCNNAPSCPSGQNRNSVSGACQTPPVCPVGTTYDNPSNACPPNDCPVGQSWQASASDPVGSCQPTSDYCDSTATAVLMCSDTPLTCIDATGQLRPLNKPRCSAYPCSAPEIPNSTNDGCINAPVFGCPIGFHANSTNNGCEADDATACPANTRHGYINGVPQCVPIPKDGSAQSPDSPTTATGDGTTQSTTTTKDANGNVTGTSTTTGSTSFQLNTTGLASESSVKAVNASIKSLSDGTAIAVTHGSDGSFDSAVTDSAIQQAQADYLSKYNQVRASISSMFTAAVSGSGSLPSFDFGNIKGQNVTVDLSIYEPQLSYVGLTVILAAWIIAAMLFLG